MWNSQHAVRIYGSEVVWQMLFISFKHQLSIWVFTLKNVLCISGCPKTCKACYFHIRALRHIRTSLTIETSKTIAAAIVGSRLEVVLQLVITELAHPFQIWFAFSVFGNTLARGVAQKPRFCHITPVLSDLHWLPVRHRISFKIRPRLLSECSSIWNGVPLMQVI